MKASVLLIACFAASPAFAVGGHAGGFFHGGGHHGHHGHPVLTPGALLNGEGGAPYAAPEAEQADAEPPLAPPLEPPFLAPAPICPNVAPAAAPARPAGPHIIHIGHKPQLHA